MELDDPRLHEASAGLVRAALPEGDTAAAQAALRQGYLENIPWNREIVAAWAQRAV